MPCCQTFLVTLASVIFPVLTNYSGQAWLQFPRGRRWDYSFSSEWLVPIVIRNYYFLVSEVEVMRHT